MLTLFSKHSKIDLEVTCNGDINVDYHHTVEDVGIVLGKAILEALGDKKGINRYADTILPMDEALILTAIDVSGRSYLNFDVDFPSEKIGDFDTELVEEFFMALTRNAEITLHIKKLAGENSHHVAEGAFKSFARTLRAAVALDENFKDQLPSTKGVL
jgi:imidazoleglycerol-phosphate dehydratase